jgi:penicillin-insensitive murein endopeptidase
MARRLRATVLALVTVAFGALTPPSGAVGGTPKKPPTPLSIGAPNAGHLEHGQHLVESAYIRYVGAYAIGDAHWGVKPLVDAIDRAAREVRRRFPDAVLGVGQLSRKDGGEIDRHHSHESGRDADLGFYLVDSLGRSVSRDRFYAIRPDGVAASDPRLRFDDARNWALVSALVSDPHARVTHIFVVTYLRTRLLAYGARVGASPALRGRIAEVLMQPHHALPHDDHFHVRVGCPHPVGQCIENAVASIPPKKQKIAAPAGPVKTKLPRPPKTPTKRLVRARSVVGGAKNVFVKTTILWPTP